MACIPGRGASARPRAPHSAVLPLVAEGSTFGAGRELQLAMASIARKPWWVYTIVSALVTALLLLVVVGAASVLPG